MIRDTRHNRHRASSLPRTPGLLALAGIMIHLTVCGPAKKRGYRKHRRRKRTNGSARVKVKPRPNADHTGKLIQTTPKRNAAAEFVSGRVSTYQPINQPTSMDHMNNDYEQIADDDFSDVSSQASFLSVSDSVVSSHV